VVSVGLCAEELALTNSVAGVGVLVPALWHCWWQSSPRLCGAGLKVRPFPPPFSLHAQEWGEDWDEQAIQPSSITNCHTCEDLFMFLTTASLPL